MSGGWAHQDSNLERTGYEPVALTIELWARRTVYRMASLVIAHVRVDRWSSDEAKQEPSSSRFAPIPDASGCSEPRGLDYSCRQ